MIRWSEVHYMIAIYDQGMFKHIRNNTNIVKKLENFPPTIG